METLPGDIINCLFDLLTFDSLNLGITCKRFYYLYSEHRNRNKFVKKRFERIQAKFAECSQKLEDGIIFDRMYMLCPYLCCASYMRILMIFCKTYSVSEDPGKVTLHYTMDKWKTAHEYQTFRVTSVKRSNLYEYTWLALMFHVGYDYGFNNLRFAFQLQYDTWDNNSGWNYDTLKEHHRIPLIYIRENCPNIGTYFRQRIDPIYTNLSTWLHPDCE